MAALALLMAVLASRYLFGGPEVYFPEQRAVYLAHNSAIIAHIAGSLVATLIGPFQFLVRSRAGRWLHVHRWLGRGYLLGVLIGGAAGLYMATLAYGGWSNRLGFAILAALWLYTGWMAYTRIRAGNIDSHRAWMIRNYALTFAAVTLRLWQGVFQASGLSFDAGYAIVAWLSWLPNLVVAEMMIRRR
jgi:uncharacterized membrane protein